MRNEAERASKRILSANWQPSNGERHLRANWQPFNRERQKCLPSQNAFQHSMPPKFALI